MLRQYNIEFDTKNFNRRGFTCEIFLIVDKAVLKNNALRYPPTGQRFERILS